MQLAGWALSVLIPMCSRCPSKGPHRGAGATLKENIPTWEQRRVALSAVSNLSLFLQVGDALLETIFDPTADTAGLVIDGFPRTAFQVELLKLLYDKMMALHVQNADSPDEWRFPRPSFKVLYHYLQWLPCIRGLDMER